MSRISSLCLLATVFYICAGSSVQLDFQLSSLASPQDCANALQQQGFSDAHVGVWNITFFSLPLDSTNYFKSVSMPSACAFLAVPSKLLPALVWDTEDPSKSAGTVLVMLAFPDPKTCLLAFSSISSGQVFQFYNWCDQKPFQIGFVQELGSNAVNVGFNPNAAVSPLELRAQYFSGQIAKPSS